MEVENIDFNDVLDRVMEKFEKSVEGIEGPIKMLLTATVTDILISSLINTEDGKLPFSINIFHRNSFKKARESLKVVEETLIDYLNDNGPWLYKTTTKFEKAVELAGVKEGTRK